ncbi:sensor domain-containing protein [Kitasatospora phosalacinea]|uniref:sensor domain-containing protein n=1 Tax=Kitasatospora phosalacinea TaxID=2065 RepID=UPI000525DA64|nr:sensor domain-containing protein [Kitasatospora phosalacinea]
MLCLAVAGGAWWLWLRNPDPGQDLHVAAGTVQADLLSPDDVSALTETTVVAGPRLSEPPPELTAEPSNCAAAVGPATRTVYGNSWKAFLAATYQDAAGTGDYTVTQVIGVYPDAVEAESAYKTLADGVKGCPTAVRTDQDGGTSTWNYSSDTSSPDAIAWTSSQYAADGWSCYRQARLKDATLLQVALCQAGDGKTAAAAIADKLAAKVTR